MINMVKGIFGSRHQKGFVAPVTWQEEGYLKSRRAETPDMGECGL